MLRTFSTKRIISFFIFDWFATFGSLFAASYLRAEIGRLPEPLLQLMETLRIQNYSFWNDAMLEMLLPSPVFILVGIIWPFFLVLFSVYDGRRSPNLMSEVLNVFLAICIATLTLAGLLYFSYRETPRFLIFIFAVLDIGLLVGARLGWGITRALLYKRPANQRRAVLVVGAGPVGLNMVQKLRRFAQPEIELIGFLDDDADKVGHIIDGLPVLGSLEQVEEIVIAHHVDDAIVALPLHAYARQVEISRTLQALNTHVHVVPDLFSLSFPNATLDGFGGIPVIDLGRPGIHGSQRAIKRAFDLVAVTMGLIFLSPLFLLITICIKLDSKGPVYYKQSRIGEFGRPFTMIKFRSMRADADPSIHENHVTRLILENLKPEQLDGESKGNGSLKLANDPRITRVGRILRKTSLDELPQLWNVFLGEMSLVGPRPSLDYEVELYQSWHKRRLEAPPGITGLWQVKGRNQVSFDEMVRMDLEYIEHQSLWLDIKLLLQTPRAVITARGAG
jgi:exopolysaccharide biosynthesis polyprenyl glycosylphosphotransferase